MWRYLFLLHIATAMIIPEDTEMLDDFIPAIPEISPQDDYFEAGSMSADTFYRSIRNKRAAKVNTSLFVNFSILNNSLKKTI